MVELTGREYWERHARVVAERLGVPVHEVMKDVDELDEFVIERSEE